MIVCMPWDELVDLKRLILLYSWSLGELQLFCSPNGKSNLQFERRISCGAFWEGGSSLFQRQDKDHTQSHQLCMNRCCRHNNYHMGHHDSDIIHSNQPIHYICLSNIDSKMSSCLSYHKGRLEYHFWPFPQHSTNSFGCLHQSKFFPLLVVSMGIYMPKITT